MASSGIGDILKYGLLAGGAYLAWNAFSKSSAAAAPAPAPASGSGGGSPPPAPPAAPPPTYAYVPPTVTQALVAAAAGDANMVNGQMNADHWAYYWVNSLHKPAIGAAFDALFFPNGRGSTDPPLMTADTFVQALATKGLSGPAGAHRVPVPFLLIRGRGYAQSPFWRQVG